jgi:hypothetical protein
LSSQSDLKSAFDSECRAKSLRVEQLDCEFAIVGSNDVADEQACLGG